MSQHRPAEHGVVGRAAAPQKRLKTWLKTAIVSLVLAMGYMTAAQAAPIATLSSAAVDFGNQPAGTSSAVQTVTLSNTGDADLSFSGVTLGGSNPGQFTLAASSTCVTGGTVAVGASCTVDLQFSPTSNATGIKSAVITLKDNASPTRQTIALTGQIIIPVASLSSTALDFGNQPAGTSSAVQTVTLSNTGDADLSFSGVTLGGSNPGQFTLAASSTCVTGGTVAVGASCTVDLQFSPTSNATGSKSAVITLKDNASPTKQTIALSGAINLANTTATLTATPNPVVVGQAVVLAVNVTGYNPTGTVTFMDGATTLGTAILNAGVATYTATLNTVGAHSMTVSYGGDVNNTTNTSAIVSLTVNNVVSATALTVNPNPAKLSDPIVMNATVTGLSPTGSVTFMDGTTVLGTSPVNAGIATFTSNFVTLGSHPLVAIYSGDPANSSSTSTIISLIVNSGVAQVYYIHTDHLNTPREITDTNGVVVWQWDNSDPFGNNSPNENPSGQGTFNFNLRFAGQYFDRETNTHYNINRDYDPATGRYIESDPIGLAGGSFSTYIYVNANPLSYIDPLGLASLYTNMRGGTTTFDPRPEDPNGTPFTIPTSTSVSSRARPDANQGFSTPDVVGIRYKGDSRAFGPDGAVIDVGDPRGRHIHGGGSCRAVEDSQADQQGWCATMGCTRGQNSDVLDLADKIIDFKKDYPGVKIPYYRY